MTILGTRPEIIRLSRVIAALDRYANHVLVYTNQSYDYELSTIFFKELRIRRPDHVLSAKSETLGGQIANILIQTEQVISKEKPDAILVLGDTNSALSGIIAKRKKIPLFHMEAGNRCFDWDVPEEVNRRIVDHISDYNLAYTEHARRYLLQEGIPPKDIIVTGSPLTEVYQYYKKYFHKGPIFKELKLADRQYILVSCHREENIDIKANFDLLMNALNDIAEKYQLPIIYSTHPRTLDRLKKHKIKPHKLIQNLKPFGFFDYNCLQLNAFCVLSDSGTLAEESAILGFSGVSLRTSTERPEVLDKGSFIVGGINSADIMMAIELTRSMKQNKALSLLATDYQDKTVSVKVVKIIQSYTTLRKYLLFI